MRSNAVHDSWDQRLLPRGHSLVQKMPRGTVIQVASGSVVLTQRIALEHGFLTQQVVLARGAVYDFRVSDWWELTAQCDAELRLQIPPAWRLPVPWRVLAQSLRSVWRGLLGWALGAGPQEVKRAVA